MLAAIEGLETCREDLKRIDDDLGNQRSALGLQYHLSRRPQILRAQAELQQLVPTIA